ncbi:DNA repair protein rad26 [Sugiyamaella lignohabitans]|uniref:DNA repair protein rad26 n=1 Tax=Sugiyamaella lignohabitans TaxID=796027 RepID=A0A167DQ45_9ASCO|nr:DNA repair protein rad26 [Sugiyamaella lignohabitans]ANB13158.1 DNA repair protein rad26 [Sugiyamaella lignohabitans]
MTGENAILRSNLSRKDEEHTRSVGEFIASQTKSKDDHMKQIEVLKKEVERLRVEKMFLSNEVQEVSLAMRASKGKREKVESATNAQTDTGHSTHANGAQETTPDNSPSKKRVKRDLEASFRDGFDIPPNSPSRRRRRQEALRQMRRVPVSNSTRSSPSKSHRNRDIGFGEDEEGGDFVMVDEVSIDPGARHPRSASVSKHSTPTTNRIKEITGLELASTAETINVTSDYIQKNLEMDFYMAVKTHKLPESTQTTIQMLDKIKFKACGLGTYLLDDVFVSKSSDSDLGFFRRCIDVCTYMRFEPNPEVNENEWPLDAGYLVLHLLDTAIAADPIRFISNESILLETIRMLVQFVEHGLSVTLNSPFSLPSESEIPWFKCITIDSEKATKTSLMICALDVLETVVLSCSLDANSSKACWSTIPFRLINSLLLSPNQHHITTNILVKTLRMLIPSITEGMLGPIVTDSPNTPSVESRAKAQLDQEQLIISTLVRHISQSQKFEQSLVLLFAGLESDYSGSPSIGRSNSITPLYIQTHRKSKGLDIGRNNDSNVNYELYITNAFETINLRRTIIQFFTALLLRRGVGLLVNKSLLVGTLTQAISHELDDIYECPQDSSDMGRVQFVNASVRLFHAIWTLSDDKPQLTRSLYGDAGHENLVAMARIALSEYPDPSKPSPAVRFDADVIDRSRDILEQCITLTEADEIYLSMYAT